MTFPNASRGANVAVAIVCGALVWPLASAMTHGAFYFLGRPSLTIVPMLAVCALAGIVVGFFSASNFHSQSKPGSHVPARAGFLTAFVAAALLVARATILHGRAGHVAGEGLDVLLAVVVTILPGTLFAMFTGGLGCAIRSALDADPSGKKAAFVFLPIHALYFACVAAMFSPFIPGLFSEPPPRPAAVATPTPAPASTPFAISNPLQAMPTKIYQSPLGLDSADAGRLGTIMTKIVSESSPQTQAKVNSQQSAAPSSSPPAARNGQSAQKGFPLKSVQPAESPVVAFINFHHQKSSNRDIAGMMSDYADRIEHYKSGVVDRAFIRNEEEKYHAPGHTVFERVKGEIRETQIAPGRIRTEYPLQVLLVKPDGSWTKSVSNVTLEIQATPQGLRIVKQNSVSRESEKVKGRGSLPPL